MGGQVPDLRGLFLRGYGGNSEALGTRQGESVYINPDSTEASVTTGLTLEFATPGDGGARSLKALVLPPEGISGHPIPPYEIKGPFSITSSANETRPENQAVRYLIRARP